MKRCFCHTRHLPLLLLLFLLPNRAVFSQQRIPTPSFKLFPAEQTSFNNFVDCNMASVWIKDTFRIFPGKFGEDPLWGDAHELRFASGQSVDEVFATAADKFVAPILPVNAAPGTAGLHGAVWFEAMYQDSRERSGKTLYALYHNENYPSTLPYDTSSGIGYRDTDWPQGLKGPGTATAVCRIGLMKSVDAGYSWTDHGIILEDLQPRLILLPHNTGINFAGGVGDPSAVANNGYLYVFYGEYGYPGEYSTKSYNATQEWKGQCISIARIALSDLDHPAGKAMRWNGHAFTAAFDGAGVPVATLQIPRAQGGGPASSPKSKYYWGPSVTWNTYLHCWVMLMAKAEGPSWKGNSIYISFNTNADLGKGNHAQQWSIPKLLVKKPGHNLWYPSLQAMGTDKTLGKRVRLFYKDMYEDKSPYLCEYLIDFSK
jgi:hypothetical protein